MSQERVQKILAKAGIASRRKAEELIVEGLVTINGRVAQLGDKAELGKDAIKVKGKLLQGAEAPVYLVFNKPKQVISMMADPEGRPTLADYLNKVKARIFPIGRLDFNSEGLILLTNDGAFAEKLQRRDDIPRVYHAKVRSHVTPEMIERLASGIKSGNRLVKPHSVRLVQVFENKSLLEIVMMGAGAIDVKSMLELKGFLVERMTRTSIGHLTLRGIQPGEFRFLKPSQVEALLEQPELGIRRLEQEAAAAKPVQVRKLHGRRGESPEDEAALAIPRPLATPKTEGAPRFGGGAGSGKSSGGKPRPPRFGAGRGDEKRGYGRGEERGPRGGYGSRPSSSGAQRGFGAGASGEGRRGEKRGFGGASGEKRGFGGGEKRGPRGGFGGGKSFGGASGEKRGPRGSFGGGKSFGGRPGAGGEKRGFSAGGAGRGEKRGFGAGGAGRGEKRGPRGPRGGGGIRVVRRPPGKA